jgi:1-aminocyclopropane-1-carboxylate deaminase/D-cysteine desulfhydrase-like pyridoxal-dependent ACC family enzyme
MTDPLPGTEPAEPPLFSAAPALRQAIHHCALGAFPTPLRRVTVAGRPLLVKRDDLSASEYGGNKVRKLEFLLAAARQAGAHRLVTAGATGSHHAFATAYHGRRLGFESSLVLFPQRLTGHVRTMLLLMAATGAELRWVPRMEAVPYGMWRARIAWRASAPWTIQPGGSDVTGALGYVNAGLELAEQVAADPSLRPGAIHIAAGTLGTVAGLAIGLAWAGLPVPIIATRITSRLVTNERVLRRLVRGTVQRLREAGAAVPGADEALRLVTLLHDQVGTGYGQETDAGQAAAAAFAEAGLVLDPTYTAKAAAALLADEASDPPLFWHTLSAHHPALLPPHDAGTALPPQFASYLAGGRV